MMELKKILAVSVILLFIGVAVAPTININTVKASQQNDIKERINQRELLFQIIVDIANNKEIQRIILKSQMSRGIFPTSEFPAVTKNQIRQMYFLGLILSKIISKSRIHSMAEQYQLNNPEMQKEISAVIEKDTKLKSEITQLTDSECDCENENTTRLWHFPVICNKFLLPLAEFCYWFINGGPFNIEFYLGVLGLIPIMFFAQVIFNCLWAP